MEALWEKKKQRGNKWENKNRKGDASKKGGGPKLEQKNQLNEA